MKWWHWITKLQYFGHLMRQANSLEKTLVLGKIEGRRRRGWQRMRWLDGITDSMDMSLSLILVFWMLSFKTVFSLSSFTFIKRLFNSSLLSAIRVVSSAYLKLLIFLPGTLIPACDLSSLAFHMMYSAYKLNKQSDNMKPCLTPFPV